MVIACVPELKMECPNCLRPMTRATGAREREDQDVHTFECKPCRVGITQTVKQVPDAVGFEPVYRKWNG